MMAALTTTNFYKGRSVEVYSKDFDFTVIEPTDPLPTLGKAVRSVLICVLTAAMTAAAPAMLTIPPGGNLPFDTSEATVVTENDPRPPDVLTMTAYMRDRAALASRIFQRTPHPGVNDDDEPDYAF